MCRPLATDSGSLNRYIRENVPTSARARSTRARCARSIRSVSGPATLNTSGIGADRDDPTVENGHGPHRSEPRVDRDDRAVVKDRARQLTIAAEVSMPRTIKSR